MSETRRLSLIAVAAALVLDQGIKILMLYGFHLINWGMETRVTVLPVLDLVMRWNCGISFSLLCVNSPSGIAMLITFVMGVTAALAWWMWNATRRLLAIGLGLVIGGALGNLVDRLWHGWVADFFDLHAFGRDFFACNPADILISLGVVLLITDTLMDSDVRGGRELTAG